MRVGDVKFALERSDGARKSVIKALEDDRKVVFQGRELFVEQRGGDFKQFHLGMYLTPQDGGLGGLKPYYVEVEG